jgi:hypothetical protein
MSARIFKPSKTAMQSGRAKTKEWVLEFEPTAAKRADPLMGWAGSTDTNGQVTLVFATKDEAVAYANRHGIAFSITAPQSQVQRPKAYADNFRFDRVR